MISRTSLRSNIKLAQKNLPKVVLKQIIFSELGDEEIKKFIEITKVEEKPGEYGTLSDPRIGPIGRGSVCHTCRLTDRECKGHMAQIPLDYPYIQVSRVRSVIEVLNCICTTCSHAYIGESFLGEVWNKYDKSFLRKYVEDTNLNKGPTTGIHGCINKECPEFGVKKMFAKKIKGSREFKYKRVDGPDITLGQLSYAEIQRILKNIPSESLEILGLSDNPPVNWVLEHVIVAPTCIRPSTVIRGVWKQHGYTQIYTSMLRGAIEMRNAKTDREKEQKARGIMSNMDKLINSSSSVKESHVKSLAKYISGKEGLIRKSILGRKSRHSGRFVIGPGPDIPWGYVGIPINIAKKCLVPVVVNLNNQTLCSDLIYSGKARGYSPFGSDDFKNLTKKGSPYQDNIVASLKIGDIIYRSLQEGDPVIMIRQPSIHKFSVMGFKANIIEKGHILRINPGVTEGYGADFDGDEMNLYIPQTVGGMAEVLTIMSVTKCQINPYNITSAYGMTYDSLLGLHILQSYNDVDKILFSQIVRFMKNDYSKNLIPRLLREKVITSKDLGFDRDLTEGELGNVLLLMGLPKISAKILLSLTLPSDLIYVHAGVKIRSGILKEGIIKKDHVGVGQSYTIPNVLATEYSEEILAFFYDDLYKLLYTYMDKMGFTVSLKDCYPTEGIHVTKEMKEEAQKSFEETKMDYYEFVQSLEPVDKIMSNPLYRRVFEKEAPIILNMLPKIIEVSSKYFRNPNNTVVAVESGSKGSMSNVTNMMVGIGQQYIGGNLVQTEEESIHKHGSIDPTQYGYCQQSYFEGLDPKNYETSTETTRRSLTDLYIKSGVVGIARRHGLNLAKEMKTNNVGAVVDHDGNILQFFYGNDGVRPGSQTRGSVGQRSMVTAGDMINVAKMINYSFS